MTSLIGHAVEEQALCPPAGDQLRVVRELQANEQRSKWPHEVLGPGFEDQVEGSLGRATETREPALGDDFAHSLFARLGAHR